MADIPDTNTGAATLSVNHFAPTDTYFGSVGGMLETAGDADRFAVTLSAGRSYTFLAHLNAAGGASASLTIQLLDADGNEIQSGSAGANGEASLFLTVPTDGQYYVRISGGSQTGSYEVDLLSNATAVVSGTFGNDTSLASFPGGHFFSGGDGADQIAFGATGYVNASGGNDADILTGDAADNTLFGGFGNDELNGGAGRNILVGGAGDDVLSNVDGTASGGGLAGWLIGGDGNDTLQGSAFDDLMDGGDGNDTLTGGNGANLLRGGAGNDVYVLSSANDVVDESSGSGTDTIQSNAAIDLSDTVKYIGAIENAVLTGSANENLLGNDLANRLTGNSGNNVLDGRGGNDVLVVSGGVDTLVGGDGDDTFVLGNATTFTITEGNGAQSGVDTITSTIGRSLTDFANVEDLVLLGSAAIAGTGSSLDNRLDGSQNSGANVLTGLAGDDIYLVGAGDTVVEASDGGTDLVGAYVAHQLADNVENLTLLGSAAIAGTGNGLANVLNGSQNSGANVLTGLGGNDLYLLGAGDSVVEAADGGTDTVQVGFSYTLGANVEKLILTGSTAITGTGNELANRIDGSFNTAGNVLTGLGGNDIYIVGAGDTVSEVAGGGTDTVGAGVSYTLEANVENLTLLGSGAIAGTGNSLANLIDGTQNTGANMLKGLAGNDTYYVGAGDVVVEAAGGGTDAVVATFSYTLPNNVETLVLFGSAAISGTGNSLANVLDGAQNAKANVLRGLGGDDTYYVGAGDVAVEAASGGKNDTVRSLVTYRLGANIEHLVLASATNQNGTGNTLANQIIGNAKVNVLDGGAGNDLLNGMAGNDTLIGGLGNDTLSGGANSDFFVFNAPVAVGNADFITDFSHADDTIRLENAVMKALGGAGALSANLFFTGQGAHDLDDRIIYNRATGALFYDDDGVGAHAAIQIAALTNKPVLAVNDFVVI